MENVAGLMSKSKYSHNVIRTNDIGAKAPSTILKSEFGTVIQLPLPLNLASSMGADWQQESVGVGKHFLMHNKEVVTQSYKDVFNNLPALGERTVSSMKSTIVGLKEDVNHIMARTGSNSKIGGLKVAVNPRNEMLFNGMQFKSYSFAFMLVPFKPRDSNSIQNAIREIQKASAPEMRGQKMFMQYPETWNIKFMSGDSGGDLSNEYLMKINECCCTNVSVNYTPNNTSVNMHEDNAPLAVELTLDFTEIFIPVKETIEDGFYG